MIQDSRSAIERSISKAFGKLQLHEVTLVLRKLVCVDPTFSSMSHTNEIVVDLNFNPKNWIRLCVMMNFIEHDEVRFLLRLFIEENWKNGELLEYKDSLLTSKEHCLATLQVQEIWDGHTFFGELYTKQNNPYQLLISKMKVKEPNNSRVVKPQRKRGYSDKGSLRPSHLSVIYNYRKYLDHFDVEATELWYQIYQDRLEHRVQRALEYERTASVISL